MNTYAILVAGNMDEATQYKLELNDKFPDVNFIITKYSNKFRIDIEKSKFKEFILIPTILFTPAVEAMYLIAVFLIDISFILFEFKPLISGGGSHCRIECRWA